MNPNKLYPCKKCGLMVKIRSKGMCGYCRNLDKPSLVTQYRAKIKKDNIKKQNRTEVLEKFFKYHLEKVQDNPYCQNCGVRIRGNICNIAHILPKRIHKDVMGDINNCIYLCASINGGAEIGCHEKLDRIQGSSQVYLMHCWPEVVNKYLKFKEDVIYYSKYKQILEEWLSENQ